MRFIIVILVVVLAVVINARTQLIRTPQSWSPPQWIQTNTRGYDEKTFSVPSGIKTEVDFWIKIYTQYSTQQGVFHLSGDTEVILGEIDLSQVYANPKWSLIRKEKESEILVRRQKRILAARHKIKDIKKIRLQMGLKDRMQEAIKLSGRYLPMMEKIFQENRLPLELTRVVFVESSFNVLAGSRVGASGLWQIMPRVANKFKYISKDQDLRNHPVYATLVAAQIFKENHQILKSWPLAVTAYNHGVGSLGKIVKKYKSNDIAYLIDNVNSKRSFGFASRNFYATYLAALHVERNANLYFPEPIYKDDEIQIRYFQLKKKLPYETLLAAFDQDTKKLKLYNPHLKSRNLKPGRSLPAEVIVNLPKEHSPRLAQATELEF
ncbi:MAG: hypothetical protein A2622_00225 [Bdellovibrionales bacterium RIFCSPHIGHO2_01_FULL_40_29]|nr:MAG: hypothetical protein A2622_00225 [Bdellovibrionales bacterium RIFCSPHIGHO2_01_FULL_40_29]OFZ32552.1 MAG: hypothetical protein A3D17_04825 [Bdellovibrionales bacterium RIFCSPHIGHO2_02_FULL_40_15]